MIFIGKPSQVYRFLRKQAQAGQPWHEVPGVGMHLGKGIWMVRLEKGEKKWPESLGEGLIIVYVTIDGGGDRSYNIETYDGESCDFMADGPDFEGFLDRLNFPSTGLYEVSGITVIYYPPDGPFGEADHDIEGGVILALPTEE